MNTNTQCNEWSAQAFQRAVIAASLPRTNERISVHLHACRMLADAIIAERTRELATNLRAQMPEPGYNTDGTRQTVSYDGLTRDEWIARELGVTVREVTP